MLKLSLDSKGYGVKDFTFYVLDWVCTREVKEAMQKQEPLCH